MEFLNDEAREHVTKLLEYLESLGIAYTLDPTVVGSADVWEYILFDIRKQNKDVSELSGGICTQPEILAIGGRYSPLVRRAHKQGIDTSTVMFTLDAEVAHPKKDIEAPLPQSSIFFGHVSDVAKKVALGVLTRLHAAGVYVQHAITRDTLTQQLATTKNPEYMVVIGHKEALAGTAIVRNEATRVQKEIPITELASYLKKLVK
jgi:histidyl-tRNA synthetase